MPADLGGASDHILDEVPVPGGIDNGDVVFAGFKFPQGDVNGDTTLSLCLQFIQDPGVLKRAFPHLSRTKTQHNKA